MIEKGRNKNVSTSLPIATIPDEEPDDPELVVAAEGMKLFNVLAAFDCLLKNKQKS
jgi:hypothetical protein